MNKTLTKTERKILVYNKIKNKGLDYNSACKELEKELGIIKKNQRSKKRKKKITFNEAFKELQAK